MKIRKNGYAAIVLITIIGLVGVYLAVGLMGSASGESFGGRGKSLSSGAFYASQSGVEDAIRRFWYIPDYGNVTEAFAETFTLTHANGSTASVSIFGDDTNRTIRSIGTSGQFVRRIETEVFLSEVRPGFLYAIHAGAGGFEILNNSKVIGKPDAFGVSRDGNVYSNASIKGRKNQYNTSPNKCHGSSSQISGSAWAVDAFDQLDTTDSGVCVVKDAHAADFIYCSVMGDGDGPNSPGVGCPILGTVSVEPAPTPIPLPDMGIDDIKSYLNSQGTIFTGNCVADGSNAPSDCTEGTGELGTIIITGSLTIPSNETILISGPVWVKDQIIIDSNVIVGLTTDITIVSQIIITDKVLTSDSNVTFNSSGTAYLLFISTYDPRVADPTLADLCTDKSISVSSNTNSVLFYATDGCVLVNANSTFHGAVLGEKIRVENQSEVEYDPALAAAIFGLTSEGGWQVKSFREY